MALIACPVPGKEKSRMLCEAFIAGTPKHATGFVFYGVKAGNHRQWVEARRSGQDWYFIDNSYFDASRGMYYRVTRNRLQHDGVGLTNYERLGKLDVRIAQRGPEAERVLVIPQSDDHMRYVLEHPDPTKWVRLAAAHYPSAHVRAWSADKPGLRLSFRKDLAQTGLLVTHTSAAAVEAVLAGVPVICDPQCAAWVFSRGARTSLVAPQMGDRAHWAGVLADNQWTVDEMKEGLAWQKLQASR